MLKPLTQFVCDTCGDIIKCPEDGWIEWISDEDRECHSFRIVHHQTKSPRGGRQGCYQHEGEPGRSDSHLDDFLNLGMIKILSFLDVGPHHETEYRRPRVRDIREFVEMTRRLTIPYYEEARLYWDQAERETRSSGANELLIYTEEYLKDVIARYCERD